MKTIRLLLCIVLLSVFPLSNSIAGGRNHDKHVEITFTWSRIASHGSNQLAVWIEDAEGTHIRTLYASQFTATGGYEKRPVSLSEWTEKYDIRNATPEQVDAISGPTPQPGTQTMVWDCKDMSGKRVSKGVYVIRMEANIKNEDKMFYRGEIKIGRKAGKGTGVITFSRPELADGQVLFRDVAVEYK